jgi:hypothetical protein
MRLDIYVERNNIIMSSSSVFHRNKIFYSEHSTKAFLENLQKIDTVLYENLLSDKNFIIDRVDLDCFESCLADTLNSLYDLHLQEIQTNAFKSRVLHPFYLNFFGRDILMNANLFTTDRQLQNLDILWFVVLEARRLNKPIVMEYTIYDE